MKIRILTPTYNEEKNIYILQANKRQNGKVRY